MTQILVGVGIAGLIALFIWGAVIEQREWEAYKTAHNCVEAGYIDSSVGIGVGYALGSGSNSGGPMVVNTYTPRKDRWLCDGNIEIYR